MIKKVVFYNIWHNGDQHVCRGLVRNVVGHCLANGIKCEYHHRRDPCLLADIPGLSFVPKLKHDIGREPFLVDGSVLYFNTWFRADKEIFDRYKNVSFNTLFWHFKKVCEQQLNYDLFTQDGLSLFPYIDFSAFDIGAARKFVDETKGKRKVLICNGNVKSGQSSNFDFAPVINKIAKEFGNTLFLVTNKLGSVNVGKNVFYTKDIIAKKNGSDLNENGFLSTHCDTIVGRFSGAYSFAVNRNNYYDNPKRFLGIGKLGRNSAVWVFNEPEVIPMPRALIVNENVSDSVSALGIIRSFIK